MEFGYVDDETDSQVVSMDEDVMAATERRRKLDDHSKALAEKLLQGWTLLDDYCPQCLTPLLRNREKKIFCAACKQWVLTEAQAAARVIEQRSDPAQLADHSHVTSHNLTTIPVPERNIADTLNKTNGITHSRVISMRGEHENTPEERNAKRLASLDPIEDRTRHLAVLNSDRSGRNRLAIPVPSATTEDNGATASNHTPPRSQSRGFVLPTVQPYDEDVARRIISTLYKKLEGIHQLIEQTQDVNELRQLFLVLEECLHAVEMTWKLV